jgi:hypothetical protein
MNILPSDFPKQKQRRHQGTTLAEMPLALWLIVIMCFVLLIIATESLRFGFFWNACRESAMQAAKCQTFQVDSMIGPSSVTTANTWAQKSTGAFTGLTLTAVNVYIVSTNVNSQQVTKGANGQKLAAAADVQNNIYSVQVELDGQIQPLIPAGFMGYFGNVPGLTGPFPVVVRSQYSSEVPQGLNQ